MSKRFTFVNVGHFANQDLSRSRNGEACEFRDFCRWLTNDSSVQRAIFQDDVLNRFQLFTLQQIAAVAGETFANRVIH